MNEETKENSPENISAVKIWTAITGLEKEVKFTNENVKAFHVIFSNIEAKIMQLTLNFKGLENINNDVKNLKLEMPKKISTRRISIIAVALGLFITFLQIVSFYIPR